MSRVGIEKVHSKGAACISSKTDRDCNNEACFIVGGDADEVGIR